MSRRLPDHPLQPNAVARWSHMSPASTRHMRQCCCNQLFYISEFAATQARESREAGRGAFGEARGGRGRCTRRRTVTRRARGGMSYPSSPTLRRSSSGSTARILPSVCRHQSNNRAVDNKNARSGLQCLFSKITAPTQHSASSLASTEFILETGPRAQQTAISIHAALALKFLDTRKQLGSPDAYLIPYSDPDRTVHAQKRLDAPTRRTRFYGMLTLKACKIQHLYLLLKKRKLRT